MSKICSKSTCSKIAEETFKQCQSCRNSSLKYNQKIRLNADLYKLQLERNALWMKNYRLKAKLEVIAKYGGHCSCCKEVNYQFLTIDHINKNGVNHRAELGISRIKNNSSSFYVKLNREPLRDDLQILCYNCHCAKDLYGNCPHQI